ncbi:MAG: hypothetical protein U1E86_20515 [Burkholderiaceae bacterium]
MIVETDRPGFQRGRRLEKLGLSAGHLELFFDDVRVPVSNSSERSTAASSA